MGTITKVLQTAGEVISKTTQTLIGEVIKVTFIDFITLHIKYTKGDETGCILQAHPQRTLTEDVAQDQSWTAAAGTKTHTLNEFTLSDGIEHYITFDVRGIAYIKFTQGGSDNDGTPTGTFKASYSASYSRQG